MMHSRFTRFALAALAVLLVASICVMDVAGQSRKKRRSRRARKPAVSRPVITNPPIAPANNEQSGDVKIVSTAEDGSATSQQTETKTRRKSQSDPEDMQQTITRLTEQIKQMQENDRALLDLERLSRAEQRAETLRSQLIDTETKLADLQSRVEQINYSVKPENIDRDTAPYGSTHPEDVRDARRRQLENERTRLQSQIRILETSRARLESAISSADAEVDLLRKRMEAKQANKDTPQPETDQSANPKKPE